MTKIIAIAVVASNGVLGDGVDQPFKFAEDWARYKRVTMGHPMIMGRRTVDAIGRFLPGRTTIVVTRHPETLQIPDGASVRVASDVDDALRIALTLDADEVYVSGGGSVYRQAWDRLTDLDLTMVHADAEGAVTFPEVDPEIWHEVSRDPRGEFDFVRFTRR